MTGQRAFERHDGVFADQPRAIRKVQCLQPQRLDFGIVDQQADVIEAERPAQRGRDRLKQLPRGQALDHRVVDFEQGPQPVALPRQLLFISPGGLRIQRVVHRHGDLPGHVLHELDVFRPVSVGFERAEVNAAQVALGREQRQRAVGVNAVGPQQVENNREARLPVEVRNVDRVPRRQGQPCRSLVDGGGFRRRPDDRTLGLQQVQADRAPVVIE